MLEAGHPVPDARGAAAAQRIADLLAGLQPDDLVLVLISGGGSALLTQPAPGPSLADLQAMTRALLRCARRSSRSTRCANTPRACSAGSWRAWQAPAHVAALVISDVIGSPPGRDRLRGPTTIRPDQLRRCLGGVSSATACSVICRPRWWRTCATAWPARLADTPKPGEGLWARVHNTVIASNVIAAEAAVAAAQTRGFNAMLLTTYLEGEAREVGRVAAGLARELVLRNAPLARPALLVAGGETTVTLRGDGLGGRNQELALGAAEQLAGLPGALVVALASDGGDGPTDAAGAVVSGDTLARARAQGHSPAAFLARNDAYHFRTARATCCAPA
ncbi:MAG: MOFRL family protein [Kouleothrix sp.]